MSSYDITKQVCRSGGAVSPRLIFGSRMFDCDWQVTFDGIGTPDIALPCLARVFERDLDKLDGRWRLVFTNNLVGLGKFSPILLKDVYQVTFRLFWGRMRHHRLDFFYK